MVLIDNIYENSTFEYYCPSCNNEFNYITESDSDLVNLMKGECNKCDYQPVKKTKFGELLESRRIKLGNLNKL